MGNDQNENSSDIFFTNAEIYGFKNIQVSISNQLRVDAITAISKLQMFCDTNGLNFDFSVLYISLLEEGALEVPLVFTSENTGYSVFFIYEVDDAKKYNDALLKIKYTPYPNAIYFSCFDITGVFGKVQSTRTLRLSDLRIDKDARLNDEYAMWWSGDDETIFSTSETKEILESIYEIQKDYESVYTGYLLQQLGILEDFGRALLPTEEKALVVHAPEDKNILLILSQEKGIRFLFPVKSTTRFYREQFLSAIRIDFLTLRLTLREKQIPKDESNNSNGTEWFALMTKTTVENEEKGTLIETIGSWGNEAEQSFGVN
ncbi:MAG: hypothetical protein HC831_16585 [Chloroflexia bacterium]|nr:hypothetical protein [Chloroflexia bacterium]